MPHYQSDLASWHYSRIKEYEGNPPYSFGCPAREQLRRDDDFDAGAQRFLHGVE